MIEKINTSKEVDKMLDHIMSTELAPHTCQIFEKGRPKGMKPYGAGVMVILNEMYFLLTASHVVEDWSDENQLFIKSKRGYISIVGTMSQTDIAKSEGVDLAFIKLDEVILPEILAGYKFLPLSKFRKHINLLDAAQYCVIGYPEINKKIDSKGIMQTGTSAYFMAPSKQKVYDYYNLKKRNHISLEFKGKGMDIRTGESKKLKGHHYGLSGCGLWLILIANNQNVYSYDYRLIGIMTDFRRGKYDCLFGNHIEFILQALQAFKHLNYKEIPVADVYTRYENS
ncbi:hypothetical protein VRU48_12040 [Pedobacter sp. KR3-3]|uniref:Trypsin-like peptidase domain-containing protein n=1 Tax=Pedobacter albus TaxID=3113905 RepID=A0ABU7I8N9_9SPHI|nr:hypothetical protein [Pedobacter sp. KR3-3]MEE1945842.1 hypothetical protein [Pedobacter sp. KR3-3]